MTAGRIKCQIAISIIIVVALCGCGLKGPPVPPDPPTALDDGSDINKRGVNIVDDSAKRLFELYGGEPENEKVEKQTEPVPEEIEEVPPEYRYLYEQKDEQKSEDSKQADEKDTKEKTKGE